MANRTIITVRDGQNVPFSYAKKNPANGLYFDNAQITAISAQVLAPDGSTITPTNAITFTYYTMTGGFKGWIASWNPASDLNSYPWVSVVLTPTRVGIPAALAMPKEVELDLSDALQRIDEFRANDQAEHDATQSAIAQIASTARGQLNGPSNFEVPDSGSEIFKLSFVYRDTDSSPATLDDPDSNRVTITATLPDGSTPTGVTLSDDDLITSGFQMVRDSLGLYSMVVTVSSTAPKRPIRFRAAFANGGFDDVVDWTVTLYDLDQLDTIESQVNAIRSTDVPAIQANVDQEGTDTRALVTSRTQAIIDLLEDPDFGLAALKAISVIIRDRIGDGTAVAGADNVRGQLKSIIDNYLNHGTFGLSKLNDDLDALLARLGITTDTGGSSSAGTAMAKLNALLSEGRLGIFLRPE